MEIFANPNETSVKQLLSESELPTGDITAQHLAHFFGSGHGPELEGVVGLELYGDVALLRSLAVAPPGAGPAWVPAWWPTPNAMHRVKE